MIRDGNSYDRHFSDFTGKLSIRYLLLTDHGISLDNDTDMWFKRPDASIYLEGGDLSNHSGAKDSRIRVKISFTDAAAPGPPGSSNP